jgi:hypothetical protein
MKSHSTYPMFSNFWTQRILVTTNNVIIHFFFLLIVIMCVVICQFFFSPTHKQKTRWCRQKIAKKKRHNVCTQLLTITHIYKTKKIFFVIVTCRLFHVDWMKNYWMNKIHLAFLFFSFFWLSTSMSPALLSTENSQ